MIEHDYRSLVADRILDLSQNLICVVSMDGYLKYVNPAWENLLGYSEDELLAKPLLNFIHPDDHRANTAEFVNIAQGKLTNEFENRYIHKNGSIRYFSWKTTPVPEENAVYCTGRDISEKRSIQQKLFQTLLEVEKQDKDINHKKKIQEKLLEALNFSQLVLETSPAGILIFKKSGPCRFANPAAAAITGATVDQLLTLNYKKMETYKKNGILADMEEALKTGKVLKREVHTINTFGEEVWFEGAVSTFKVAEEQHILYFFADIIERKRAEKEKARLQSQLRQAMKMQAVGTLAGGVAHEFNNMLGIIMIAAELASEEVAAHSFVRTQLDNILKASERVKDLVKQILSFSRQAQQKKKTLDLCKLIKEILKLLRSSIPSSVEIKETSDISCGNVHMDPNEIQQILMNLISNAVWAMDEKGTIEIHLSQLELSDTDAGVLAVNAGKYLRLSVRDSGRGMDNETKSRLYEPFFSRKEIGKGTGMGLSIVYAIMKSYGGAITVESTREQGTTFHLYFQITEKKELESKAQIDEIKGGSERILFVDDEEDYAELGTEQLKRLGYVVDMRLDSMDALNAFKTAPESYDLIISDQVMPNLTGVELIREIRSIRADIPVILCTGYSSQINEEQIASLEINGFIYKPILKKDIAPIIRRILDHY